MAVPWVRGVVSAHLYHRCADRSPRPQGDTMTPPTTADLRAYLRGQLSPERYTAVDCWLDQHPEMAEKLLEEAGADDTGALAQVQPTVQDGFVTDGGAGRLRPDGEIGAGGMAVVAAARDRS